MGILWKASIDRNFDLQSGQTHPLYPPDFRKLGFAVETLDALANELQ
jgi:hypothetical protein